MFLNIMTVFTVWMQLHILITETGALPRWSSVSPKNHDRDINDGCVVGRCVRLSECPAHATLFKPTGECAVRENGPWICALEGDNKPNTHSNINDNPVNVISESTKLTSSGHWKTTPHWRRNPPPKSLIKTTTQRPYDATTRKSVPNNDKDLRTYTSVPDKWNRNTKDALTTSSSREKTSQHFWLRSTSKPENRWTSEDKLSSSGIRFPTTQKTWNRQPSHPNRQSTQFSHRSTTPRMEAKPDSRIVHNPYIVSSERITTKLSSTTKNPISNNERIWKTYPASSDQWNRNTKDELTTPISVDKANQDSWRIAFAFKPENKWTKTSEDKPSPAEIRYPTTKKTWIRPSDQSFKKTTYSWRKPVNSNTENKPHSEISRKPYTGTSERTTKHSSIESWTENSKFWDSNRNRKTTAMPKQESKSATAYPKRVTASNIGVRGPLVAAEKRKTAGWHRDISTTSEKWIASRNSSTQHSVSKKASSTTPLPNVNIQLCGLRNVDQGTNRRVKKNLPNSNNDAAVLNHISGRSREPFQRIVGGKEAKPFSWPWVAALYKVTEQGGNRFLSAGSLINEHFVLTAAHVFTSDDLRSSSYVVMLGTHTAKEAVAEYMVTSVIRHPEYQQRYYYNDIALLRLDRPVSFNDYVMPICLPSPTAPLLRDENLVGKNVTVMGWGDDSYGGVTSRVLKEATVPIVSRRSCNDSYVRVASNRFPKGITENMLCAGSPNGGKDACQGDSGGPLTSMENGRYTQVGIVSFGYKCGDKEFPGVYTKVAPYLSWIAQNTIQDNFYHGYGDYHRR
ncbi:serine proteinase stubble-like [Stegodyphus dumicola]|uniref:serine proteinase stubble-like n=1 Tax=Stegodyphus dumicola TaxID=202533 RepID=UPI0015B1A5A1|nr:serine proteinase stubble-like [Stegodyphus dumicola]XP_035208067.1 serine proteinase stubble-like [Stegodyphus dumicola]